jgi:hypothetical protein
MTGDACRTPGASVRADDPGERALTMTYSQLRFASSFAVVMTLASPARADFFDGARRTFQTDIPHFFQDDIPCAFGGQPTSHTKTSCKSPSQPAKQNPVKDGDRVAVPPGKTDDAPAKSGR